MKKIVLTFGLISGVIMSALMTAVIVFAHQTDPTRGMVIGYTIMVLSFLLIFFGFLLVPQESKNTFANIILIITEHVRVIMNKISP